MNGETLFQRPDKLARPGKSHIYRGGALSHHGAELSEDGDGSVYTDEAAAPLCGMTRSFGPFQLIAADEIDDAADESETCAVCAERALKLRDSGELLTGEVEP